MAENSLEQQGLMLSRLIFIWWWGRTLRPAWPLRSTSSVSGCGTRRLEGDLDSAISETFSGKIKGGAGHDLRREATGSDVFWACERLPVLVFGPWINTNQAAEVVEVSLL